jgi:hypothetical protein
MLPGLNRELQCANDMCGGRRLCGCGDGKFGGAVGWRTAQYVLRLLSGDERYTQSVQCLLVTNSYILTHDGGLSGLVSVVLSC